MATRRTYNDRCGVARALEVVGERWALLVVRELLLGPKRFTALRAGLPNLSPDVLAQRLRELERAGAVRRRTLPAPAASKVYELSPLGAVLEPVIIALGRWGARTPPPPSEVSMSLNSHVLTLRTLYEPELAGGLEARVELRLGDQRFRAEVTGGRFEIVRGEEPAPDAIIETEPATLLALVRGRRELREALRAGDIAIEGDRGASARFLTLFPLPEPVG